jgi:hypothetical protein
MKKLCSFIFLFSKRTHFADVDMNKKGDLGLLVAATATAAWLSRHMSAVVPVSERHSRNMTAVVSVMSVMPSVHVLGSHYCSCQHCCCEH